MIIKICGIQNENTLLCCEKNNVNFFGMIFYSKSTRNISIENAFTLQKLSKKGVATLMATHDLFRAKEVATNIGIMKGGKLKEQFRGDKISLSKLEKLYLKTMDYNNQIAE